MHVDIFKKKITTERARGEREFGEFGLERENRRRKRVRVRLVIEFEICCLKRCENYCLKSVVEKRVF